MLIFHQGVSSTKAKKGNSAYFKISEQKPISVKEELPDTFSTSWKRLQDPKANESQGCAQQFYNFISDPYTMYVPIKYTNSQSVQFA